MLGRIYTKECRYFMPFISKHYVEKAWPNFEFKIALTKAIQSQESFVLPVRIDDTKLTLLDESIFYLDSRQISPAEIARNAAVKLGYPDRTMNPMNLQCCQMVFLPRLTLRATGSGKTTQG